MEQHTWGRILVVLKMLLSFRLQRLALVLVLSSFTYITINGAHAEVASVYGGPDGLCGSRTANGERVNCAAMTAAPPHVAIRHAVEGLSSWLCRGSHQ
jgi:hypothetical protein